MATITYTATETSITFSFRPASITGTGTYRLTYTSGSITNQETFDGTAYTPPTETTITGLTKGTSYTFSWEWAKHDEGTIYDTIESGTITVTTLDNTPKMATVTQWQDLADRVNAKADSNMLSYSTSEIDTGATWIDGKTIYKKTINYGALPNAATQYVAHLVPNIDRIIKIEGIAERSTQVTYYPLPYTNPTDVANQIAIGADKTEVWAATGTNSSGISAYITIYYTKGSSQSGGGGGAN